MRKPIRICTILLILCSGLIGCAKQATNIDLSQEFWQQPPHEITVANAKPIKPTLYQQGNTGILDFVVNSAVNSKLVNHLRRVDMSWYQQMGGKFVKRHREQHIQASSYSRPIMIDHLATHRVTRGGMYNQKFKMKDASAFTSSQSGNNAETVLYSKKNYTALATQVGNGKLLLTQIDALGARRHFYGFIPTGKPQAFCSLSGRLIDIKTNHILWKHKVNITQDVSGPWDQPPNFPNFDRALNQAINFRKSLTNLSVLLLSPSLVVKVITRNKLTLYPHTP